MHKEKKWALIRKSADYKGLSEHFHVDPVIIRLMINRGIEPEEMNDFLHPRESMLHDPSKLLHAGDAVELLSDAISTGMKIRVIGDYDIDGIMSVYILTKAIEHCGGIVSWAIPERIRDGYGLNPRLVEAAKADGTGLIITCDNGIAAGSAISLAKSYGIKVIVTDHHQIPYDDIGAEVLPDADVVVDPHLKDDHYPFSDICGAVVAWRLSELLIKNFEKNGIERDRKLDNYFLQAAAVATVGDVMPLRDENRAIVALGLNAMKTGPQPGLRALMDATETGPDKLDAFRIGFVLGPCLNASGRIETADIGEKLMQTDDYNEAQKLAGKLSILNEERKTETKDGTDLAMDMAESEEYSRDTVLVLYLPGVRESVAGIIAGRVRERTAKPVIVFCDSEADSGSLKGSARSIPAYNMYERLHDAERYLTVYGGHPMAAGMTIPRENLDGLREYLNDHSGLKEDDLFDEQDIDCDMTFEYLCSHHELMDELSLLEPFGNGNEKPVFAVSQARIVSARTIGKDNQYLKLVLKDRYGRSIDALCFSGAEDLMADLEARYGLSLDRGYNVKSTGDIRITVSYYPSVNEYKGIKTTQCIITDYLLPD